MYPNAVGKHPFHQQGSCCFSWGGFEGRPLGETENWGVLKRGQRNLSSWGWVMPLRLGRVLGGKLRGVGSHVVQNCPSLAESLWRALSYGPQDAPRRLFLSEVPYQLFPIPMGWNPMQRREITKVLQALSACCRMWPPLLTEQPLFKMSSILLVDRAETGSLVKLNKGFHAKTEFCFQVLRTAQGYFRQREPTCAFKQPTGPDLHIQVSWDLESCAAHGIPNNNSHLRNGF